MSGARALAVVVLLLSYGAVGARQPAVRATVPLGANASDVARTVGIEVPDRSRLLLDIVRIAFDAPDRLDAADARLRVALQAAWRSGQPTPQEAVPLPLDPSIWRDSILQRQVSDTELIPAIFADRSTALLYHGLAALDDETLAALGPDRETLQQLRRRAGPFAALGRSVRIHAGRVVVPGGAAAEPLWQSLVGADPAKPGAFTRRLFSDLNGRLAYMYDVIAHLDPARQRFALGLTLPAPARLERFRTLLDVFEQMSSDWRLEDRPFTRPQVDPGLTLSLVAVTDEGRPIGPVHRRLWTQVFRGDETVDVSFVPAGAEDFPNETEDPDVDAAWLVSRIQRTSPAIARRRLETFLFAQRMWPQPEVPDPQMASALRGFIAFPSLLLGLERIGLSSADMMVEASARALSLTDIRDEHARRIALTQFQAVVGILERAVTEGGVSRAVAQERMTSLLSMEVGDRGYDGRLASWVKNDLVKLLPEAPVDSPDPMEDAVLAAMAGISRERAPGPIVQWEDHAYRVDPAQAELTRLKRVRDRQRGASLDAALDALAHVATTMTTSKGGRSAPAALASQSGVTRADGSAPATVSKEAMARAEQAFADTLTSILYAAHIGDPDGAALEGGNVALRHDLGISAEVPRRPLGAWRLPSEQFGGRDGWRVVGSLIGLETALGRLSLRRLDTGEMPAEPRLSNNERQTLTLTVALLRPGAMTNAARDEIAQAVARGRARLASMSGDRDELDRVAREAGLSEWRREALGWTLAHDREAVARQLSLVELLWLGAPRPSEAAPLDPWGAAILPLTGAVALQMPRARAWEDVSGRAALGLLATRGADVAIAVAEALAARHLPGSLASGVVAFAMQDVIDGARLAYFDDWSTFSRTAGDISSDRMSDYIAALTAAGPLIPAADAEKKRH